jgi:hypothetical protein
MHWWLYVGLFGLVVFVFIKSVSVIAGVITVLIWASITAIIIVGLIGHHRKIRRG